MKKSVTMLFTFLLLIVVSHPLMEGAIQVKVGGSVHYYVFKDSLFKDIYGTGGIMLGAFLALEPIKRLELRGEYNYIRTTGKMTISKEKLNLTLAPILLGVRFKVMDTKMLSPYLGIGAGTYSLREDYPERIKDVSESTGGYHAEIGAYFKLMTKVQVDLNLRYVKASKKSFDQKVQLGGFRAGIGVGYTF